MPLNQFNSKDPEPAMYGSEIDQLVRIFSNAAAPAFLLGAIAAFISLISLRASSNIARLREVRRMSGSELEFARDVEYARLLEKRIRLLHSAIQFSLAAGVSAAILLVLIFCEEFFGLHDAYGSGILFLVSNLFLGATLVRFAQEVWIGLHDLDFH
jgi:hypothetical protein